MILYDFIRFENKSVEKEEPWIFIKLEKKDRNRLKND